MTPSWRIVRNAQSSEVVLRRAQWCSGLWCHFRGLMFRGSLDEDEGLLFVYPKASIANTTIHMLFVFFAIAVIWLDEQGRVVDAKLARPWRLIYAPSKPARYFIEARPALLDRVNVGDVLIFDEVSH